MPFDPSSEDAWSSPGPLRITVHPRLPNYPLPGAPLVPGGAYDNWSSWLGPPGDGSSSSYWPGLADVPSFLNGPASWAPAPASNLGPASFNFAFPPAPTDPSNNDQSFATAPFADPPTAQPPASNPDLQSALAAVAQLGLFGNLAGVAPPPTPAPPLSASTGAPPASYADHQTAMAQAAQRGLLGRLAEIVTPQSSAAEVQVAMRAIAQRTLLGKLADTAPPVPAATSIPALGPYPNDWMVAPEDGYPGGWIPTEKAIAPGGYPNRWLGPPNSVAPTIQPNVYPKDWITPSTTPLQNAGFVGAGYLPLDSLAPGRPRPTSQIDNWQSVQSSLQAPPLSPYLVPVSGTAQARPWWAPAPPGSGWEPWAEEFIKGMQGLANYFRSRGGAGTPKGGGEGDCYDRWEREDARCTRFRPWGDRVVRACKERASARRDKCIRNGGRPDPDEPFEYDFRDIP